MIVKPYSFNLLHGPERLPIIFFLILIFCTILSLVACGSNSTPAAADQPQQSSNSEECDSTNPCFKIGGTVTGLNGNLTLYNGNEALPLNSNGSFSFTTSLKVGTAYQVSFEPKSEDLGFSLKPSNQNCSITNGEGIVAAQNVNNLVVQCSNKIWIDPQTTAENVTLDGTSVSDILGPKATVAMNSWGDTLVVWVQYTSTPGHRHIFMSERRNGVWHHPTSFNDHIDPQLPDGSPEGSSPAAAIDDSGNAIITWSQSDGSKIQLFKSEYRNGAWHHPLDISDNISPDGFDVVDANLLYSSIAGSVAMDNHDHALITWSQFLGNGSTQIFKSEYRNGAWTNPSNIADYISPANASNVQPQAVMTDNGDAIITWIGTASDNSTLQVFKSEYRLGVWHHPVDAEDNISPNLTTVHSYKPMQTAMNKSGDTIIPWIQTNGPDGLVYMSKYINGVWTHPTGLSDNLSPAGAEAQTAFAAIDSSGNWIVSWLSKNLANEDQLFRAEYHNGVLSIPTTLSQHFSPAGYDVNIPPSSNVAMDDNGNAVISWSQFNGTKQVIFRAEYRGAAWHDVANLADSFSPGAGSFDNPTVALGNNGDAVIVYLGNDAGYIQLYLSEYR